MAGLLAKAKAKVETTAKASTKKQTIWTATDPKIAGAVKELVRLDAEVSALNTKMGIHKNAVKAFAKDRFITDFAATSVLPETPMNVVNGDGEKVTYIMQDRSSQYQVKDDQKEALTALLGADAVADLLYEETSFGFNRDIMAVPGVSEIVEKALERAIQKLTDDSNGKPVLTPEQAELLLDAKTKTAFRPGTLARLPLICGRDTVKMSQFLEAMGSSATNYVKT